MSVRAVSSSETWTDTATNTTVFCRSLRSLQLLLVTLVLLCHSLRATGLRGGPRRGRAVAPLPSGPPCPARPPVRGDPRPPAGPRRGRAPGRWARGSGARGPRGRISRTKAGRRRPRRGRDRQRTPRLREGDPRPSLRVPSGTPRTKGGRRPKPSRGPSQG